MPPNLSTQERARRKRALNSAITAREQVIARWSLYIRDENLERALARMREELATLKADRAALDTANPGRLSQLGRSMLWGDRG